MRGIIAGAVSILLYLKTATCRHRRTGQGAGGQLPPLDLGN